MSPPPRRAPRRFPTKRFDRWQRAEAVAVQTGDLGKGVSVLSYTGKFQFGLITDAALTPVPEAIVSRFAEEFQKYPARTARAAVAPNSGREGSGKRLTRPGYTSSFACSASSFCIASAGAHCAASL